MPGTRVYTRAGRRPDPGAGHDMDRSALAKRACRTTIPGKETSMDARTSRYPDVYARWQRDPRGFWAEAAAEIDWVEPAKAVFDAKAGVYGRWFAGAVCNSCYNALDRHVLRGRGSQAALIYDSPVTNTK